MRPGAEDEPILAASQSHLKGTEPTKEVTKNQVSNDLRIQEQTIGHQERVYTCMRQDLAAQAAPY